MGVVIRIARCDGRAIAKLLREFQIHLESAIETACLSGESQAFEAIDEPHVRADRATFKRAERLIRTLDIACEDRRRPKRLASTDSSESPDSQDSGKDGESKA
jgi:hypothetical protein